MPLEEFPIVCWRINEDAIFAKVLGAELTLVESDSKKIKKNASEGIAKIVRDGEYYVSAPDIVDPKIHIHTVDIQLSYREDSGTYPLATKTPFKVAAVYGGVAESGFGECFLPYLEEEFYYYSQEQRSDLIKHYTREFLQNLGPESAYRYIMPSIPWLETIRVRTDAKKAADSKSMAVPRLLRDVADQLPASKKIRKNITRLPDMCWERSGEIAGLASSLEESRGNCILVGGQGVGKSVLWTEAIKQAARNSKVESELTFWRSSSQRLVGKAKYLGEWQQICDEVVEALAEVNGVLWISDFMSLFKAGGEAQEDSMAAYLQSYVQKGQLRIIGEMRPQELELARSLLPGFVHLFKQVRIDELSRDASRRVLEHLGHYASSNFALEIHREALDCAFQLANRYLTYEKRPGNIVRFFGECAKNANKGSQPKLSKHDVIEQFVAYTGLPEDLLRDDRPLTRDTLVDFFSERIKGQDDVVSKLSNVVQIFKSGLNDPERPIATMLFAGPTGVGKTAATKALAEFFFSAGQKNNPLFSLDMSEFQHPGQISRLIGDRTTPGKLISHVRSQPFSVILFDEIEKAHPSVFDMLLGVLDEGILTDQHGRLTDFRSSIIIMTSNLGAKTGNTLGFVDADAGDDAIAAVKKHFRPEFFNRIDLVLNFKPLQEHAIEMIVRRELELLHKRDRIVEQGIKMHYSEKLVAFICNIGFSPRYGARPIQRAIEKHVVGTIAKHLIQDRQSKSLFVDFVEESVVVSSSDSCVY